MLDICDMERVVQPTSPIWPSSKTRVSPVSLTARRFRGPPAPATMSIKQ